MADARFEHMFKARICEQAEQYEDMVAEITKVVNDSVKTTPLTFDERRLLSVAYQNLVGAKRSSWRIIARKLAMEKEDEQMRECCLEMKRELTNEINEKCGEIHSILDKVISKPENDEAKLFFLKMKGDYYRYMVEMCDDSEKKLREELMDKSENEYKKATEVAKEKLETTNPIRLGLALNYSVFLYEIRLTSPRAIELAKGAFDDALKDLDDAAEHTFRETETILRLLRDNLTFWSQELEGGGDGDDNVQDIE